MPSLLSLSNTQTTTRSNALARVLEHLRERLARSVTSALVVDVLVHKGVSCMLAPFAQTGAVGSPGLTGVSFSAT